MPDFIVAANQTLPGWAQHSPVSSSKAESLLSGTEIAGERALRHRHEAWPSSWRWTADAGLS